MAPRIAGSVLLLSAVLLVGGHHAPIVSAASIVAKVIRDREMDRLKEKFGEDMGSGYPGDPKTKTWLRAQLLKNRLAILGLPSCVRVKWSTVRRLRDL